MSKILMFLLDLTEQLPSKSCCGAFSVMSQVCWHVLQLIGCKCILAKARAIN
jgi:hypothetical protein